MYCSREYLNTSKHTHVILTNLHHDRKISLHVHNYIALHYCNDVNKIIWYICHLCQLLDVDIWGIYPHKYTTDKTAGLNHVTRSSETNMAATFPI